MKNPTLVIMAAGMGSRFGGLKQITPVDEDGHMIIDFSLYDAWKAGFRDIVFIIKHEIEDEFKEKIGTRMEKHLRIKYVFQEIDTLPEGYSVPEGRTKPWGTGHAIACCKDVVDGSFAVINSDDFYGPSAFKKIYDFLKQDYAKNAHSMVGYLLKNTVTEHGYVARGVCSVKDGYLKEIIERTHIVKRGEDAAYTQDCVHFEPISGNAIVSMNLWGFRKEMIEELNNRFPEFLDKNLLKEPLKCEYFLPTVANALIKEGAGTVKVLPCNEAWYGVTYQEDLQSVISAIKAMKNEGIYPEKIWEQIWKR